VILNNTTEAGVPILTTLRIADALGIELSLFEEVSAFQSRHIVVISLTAIETQNIVFQQLLLYETGAHTGKEIPVVSFLPPVAPIANALTGCDHRLIEYHTKHHMLFNCNYR